MTFQPGPFNPAGGVYDNPGSYDDAAALQLLSMRQPPTNVYQLGPGDYLPLSSSTTYRAFGNDYPRVYSQGPSGDPLLQPLPELSTGQQKVPYDITFTLHELKQGISSIESKCDILTATVPGLQTKFDNLAATTSGLQTKCDNLTAAVLGLQTKSDNLTAAVSGLQDWMNLSVNETKKGIDKIDEMKQYIERLVAWSLSIKEAVERGMGGRNSIRDQAAEWEDSAGE